MFVYLSITFILGLLIGSCSMAYWIKWAIKTTKEEDQQFREQISNQFPNNRNKRTNHEDI